MLDDHISLGTTFAGYVLDTKDLIIIAGSIFFVLIVAHGLWVARRNRQNAIHMDIKASETMDESSLDQTSADFPNGGARIISQALQDEGVETRGEERSKDASAPAEDASMAAADGPAQAIAEGDPRRLELTIYSIPKMLSLCQRQGPPNGDPLKRTSPKHSPSGLLRAAHPRKMGPIKENPLRVMRDVGILSWKNC